MLDILYTLAENGDMQAINMLIDITIINAKDEINEKKWAA
jgi:hypothetical protein